MKLAAAIISIVFISSTVFAATFREALEKNLWDSLIAETDAVLAENLANGTVFKDASLAKYEKMIKTLCADFHDIQCMPVYFTKNTGLDIAAAYPNQVIQINKQAVADLSDDEVLFVLAHEYGHHHFKHSRNLVKLTAKFVYENGIVVTDEMTVLNSSFIFKGTVPYYHKVERQADDFAFKYLAKKHHTIDCEALFKKLLNGQKASTDMHDSPGERCRKPSLLKRFSEPFQRLLSKMRA